MGNSVELEHVRKLFGGFSAVDDISISVQEGEFITFLGASGSGKTTTLRMIAGFEQPTQGLIVMGGQVINALPPFKRNVNTVFQNYALFPHMSAWDNVAYGLRMKGIHGEELRRRVDAALEMVQLPHLAKRAPRQLSGGQQQRVALARALVNRPAVLLLDEPLGALDLKLRKEMQLELKHLQTQVGITFIYVTHDQDEALTMSNRIALMRSGRIEQVGTPSEIYERPATRYVADFIGETNLFEGRIRELGTARAVVEVNGLNLIARPVHGLKEGSQAWLSVRPEIISVLKPEDAPPGFNVVQAVVDEGIYAGSMTKLLLKLPNGHSIRLNTGPSVPTVGPGGKIRVGWQIERGVLLAS